MRDLVFRSIEHVESEPGRGSSFRPRDPYGAANPKELYAWTYEHLLFPVWQKMVRGRSIFDLLEGLESTQWLPREELDAVQLSSLKALLTHAGAHVPYYRELFAKLGFDPRGVTSRADLRALPLLTKDIVRERYEDLLDPSRRGKNIQKGTSGTTGRPVQFEYDNESETWRQAVRLRGYRWAGYKLGLPALHYWAQPPVLPKGMGAAKIKVDRALRREVYVDAIPQDEASLLRAVDTVRRLRPHVIIGYTQATALFARFVNEQKLRDWESDIPVICGAEAVLPSDRAAIERAFGPAFETYGSRETMLIGAECHAHHGMHLSEENLVVEILQDGAPAADGDPGDVVVTDLHNYAMPFIRYVNGDVATMDPSPRCACGRGLRKLERVEGRRCDTLRDPTGAPIPGMLFIALFARRDDLVSQFQVVQKRDGTVKLMVVPGHQWDAAEFDRIVTRFRAQLRGLPLEVETKDSIPPSASGKRRPIVVEPGDEAAE